MAGILHVKQSLCVLDETDKKNAKRAQEPDKKHSLQNPDYDQNEEISQADIVFDTRDAE